jgi:peptide/nickel transport system permease protein
LLGYIARRLLALIPLLLIVSFIVFCLELIAGGDPVRGGILPITAKQSQVDAMRHKLYLDRGLLAQYWHWLSGVLHGDLGSSWYRQTESVRTEIAHRFPVTFSMAIGALVVSLLIGIPLGLLAGTKPQSARDRSVTVTSAAAIAAPDFWIGMMLIIIFAVNLKMLPAGRFVPFTTSPKLWYQHLVLVWFAMGIPAAASLSRQLRGSLIDAMEQDYVRTARAKGLSERRVVMKHALKNASLAPVTVIGLTFAYTLGGTIVLENIFNYNGLGAYLETAVAAKDIPVIQGVVLFIAVTFVVVNLLVDIMYAYLNPKVRLA